MPNYCITSSKLACFFLLFLLSFFTGCTVDKNANSGDSSQGHTTAVALTKSPCDQFEIPNYQSFRTTTPPTIDGQLDESQWKLAPKSPNFRDLISGSETRFDTKAAVLWDEENLYVAYWVEEPNLQASITERDGYIYEDNDVELFVAGEDAYYEFEVNAYGTIYEVFFVWEDMYKKGGYDTLPDLGYNEPKRRIFDGVGYKSHPRNPRIGFWRWDLKGLKSAVHVKGTINDDSDTDQGWTVEIALPWSSLEILSRGDGRSVPPNPSDTWRMDFSRFNQKKEEDSGGWAWSPHGVWDSHVPECFTYVTFSNADVSDLDR